MAPSAPEDESTGDAEGPLRQWRRSQCALLLLFTAEFSTASLDLKDGIFTDPRVVAHVERAFVPVHVDLTEPTLEASAVAGRFGVQFTPQIVYVDATTQNRLAMDTTTLVDPDVLLEHLSAVAS